MAGTIGQWRLGDSESHNGNGQESEEDICRPSREETVAGEEECVASQGAGVCPVYLSFLP